MPNSSYWQKRFEKIEESATKKGADYYDSLDKEYRKAQRAIDAKIKVWYQRFANNNEISLSEARKLLNSDELEEFKWDVQDYIKYGQENAFTQEWMKELENASAKVHISRLEALKLQLQQETEVLYGNQFDGIDKLARDIYTDTYYHTAFEIQKGFNVGWDFQRLDNRKLDKVISKPWTADGNTFSDKLWTQQKDLINTVHTELTQAIMRGSAPDKAIEAISRKFQVSKGKAGRLVMTESAYFSSVAQKDCFGELDVEKFEIVATLDSHTSELCQSMDGVVQDMKDYQPGVTAPPFHPWCRTTTVPYFDDDEGYRAARGEDGKTYYVPSNMKYGEWKEKFVDDGNKIDLKKLDFSDTIKENDKKSPKPSTDILKDASKEPLKKVLKEEPLEEISNKEPQPERVYKNLTFDEFKEIKHSITKEERKIVYGKGHFSGYINSCNARKMNAILREGDELPSDYRQIADTLQGIIDKNTLPDDIAVHRFVNGDALESITGVKMPIPSMKESSDDFFTRLEELPKLIKKGHVYTEKGFLSTSAVIDKNVMQDKAVLINIKAPSGSHCYITTNNKESEIIFGQNTKLEIQDVRIENSRTSKWKVVLDCIIVQ